MPKRQVIMKNLPRVMVFPKRMTAEDYDGYFIEIPRIGEEIAAVNPGFLSAGNPRESYIDGIWNKEGPAEWLTEVQVPVKRA